MPQSTEPVDWSTLEHAYGTAEDTPEHLRALADPDQDVRHEAFGELLHSLVHQGTRYQASAYAVPALIDLVADPEAPDRELIALLVAWIAIGSDEARLPDGIRIDRIRSWAEGGAEVLARGRFDRTRADLLAVDAYAALTAWEAVRDGLRSLRPLLRDEDPGVRTVVAYTLGWFPDDAAPDEAAASLAALADLLTGAEPDEGTAAVAVVAAGLIGAEGGARLATAALDDERALVRWGAAVALARLHGPAADPRVAAELARWAGGGSRPNHEIPFLEGDLAGYATLALRQLGPEWAEVAFAASLSRLPQVDAMEALTVAGEAFRHAFPGGPVPAGVPFDGLGDPARRLVRVLADAPGSWHYEGVEFGNFSSLVGGYGLPDTQPLLHRYAYGDRTHGEATTGA
ncbi:hypothetical protein ACIBF5_13425 [Micromonospora sp. NPDC050417]|uniref:hypothetical protein n=1 Tax=Micromonospora sp. NPDC050417 TaxID=3364280 RepID=UPI0037BCF39B